MYQQTTHPRKVTLQMPLLSNGPTHSLAIQTPKKMHVLKRDDDFSQTLNLAIMLTLQQKIGYFFK